MITAFTGKLGLEEMERVVLFRMRLLSAILAIVALSACVDNRFLRVVRGTEEAVPAFQLVDDSVRLIATEWAHHLFGTGPAVPSSDADPDRYDWSSSNAAVVEIRPSGWMVARAPGHALITVRGPGSIFSQGVTVCSRDAYLHIDPDDPVMNLGDTITVRVSFQQPTGGQCGDLGVGPLAPQLSTGRQGLEPILGQPNRWRAIRRGTYWYTSTVSIAEHVFADSIFVTIR